MHPYDLFLIRMGRPSKLVEHAIRSAAQLVDGIQWEAHLVSVVNEVTAPHTLGEPTPGSFYNKSNDLGPVLAICGYFII